MVKKPPKKSARAAVAAKPTRKGGQAAAQPSSGRWPDQADLEVLKFVQAYLALAERLASREPKA